MTAPEAPRSEGVHRARATLHRLFETARAIDIRHFEESSSEEVSRLLSGRVRELLQQSIELSLELLGRYDAPELRDGDVGGANFELAVDTVLAQAGGTKVADLAFMALTELRQRLARVGSHGPDVGAWDMVCDCGSGVRRVQKSLAALEQALCEVEDLAPGLRFDSELENSLRVRRQYAKLWRFVGERGAVTTADARLALRGAGTLCAMLVGSDVYCRLRERDRYELRQLQRRVLAWLVQDPIDLKAGLRLWEDWAGFVEMLRHVSLRQELVHHDGLALQRAEAALAQGLLDAAHAELSRLVGLDDGLDAARQSGAPLATLLAHVRRVGARFIRESASSPTQAAAEF